MSMRNVECDHTVGHLVALYSLDEGPGSTVDLAADFAEDDTFAVYVSHHEMAKEARQSLARLATGLRTRIEQLEGEI